MAKGSARRARVIKAMIAFVAILAVLTFFSNTIMNMTIPKVVGSYASRGNLSYSNGSKGDVVVDNQIEIKGLEGRVVDEIKVTGFDSVKKGDTILTLKPIEDDETLATKKASLKTLEREKAYEARQPKQATDFSIQTDAINTAKTTLSEAKDTLKKVQNKKSAISNNQKIIDEESVKKVSLEATVAAAAKTVEDLKTQIDKLLTEKAPLDAQITVYKETNTPEPTEDELLNNSTPYAILVNKVKEKEEEIKKLNDLLKPAEERMNEASADLAECEGKISKAEAAIESLEGLPSEASAKNEVTSAQNALNKANKDYSDEKKRASVEADKAKDTENDRDEAIAKLKEEIAKLEEAAKITEIKAPANGLAYNITVASGDTLTAKTVVGYILPEEHRECSVTFKFDTKVAQNIWTGQQLEITSGFASSCTVISKKPDPENPRGQMLVKCHIDSEDSWPGEEITVNAGRGNDNYKCVVSSSAVNEDNNGTFVYAIIGSSTPLGDKYTVKRIDVSVEATDGAFSAITSAKGELDKYDVMIVIRSEKPLEDGQRVRLEDYTAK
jgi:multidrug resistance efflux pump